jgi:pimeloyl-ACP methyl ester carboxylesterase
MSVPFTQSRGAPVEAMAKVFADQFFYIVYFQTVGVAEHELEAETRLFLRNFLFSASGEGMSTGLAFGPAPREGTGLLDTLVEAPTPLPGWLSDDDVDNYTSSFNVSGFFGPLSFYRNMDANWERSRDIPPSVLAMPIGFLTGSLDPVRFMTSGAAEDMANVLPDFRGVTIIEGAGHWIQQERPEATNEALLAFLASLQ